MAAHRGWARDRNDGHLASMTGHDFRVATPAPLQQSSTVFLADDQPLTRASRRMRPYRDLIATPHPSTAIGRSSALQAE